MLLLYAAVTVPWLSPFSLHLKDYIWDPGDSFLNAWALAWDWRALTSHPLSLFEGNILWPAAHSLAFSEHLIVQAILAAPVLVATGNPLFAHNLLLAVSFPLTGLGVYLLVKRLTGSFWAGLLAGFFFAFCPYRILQATRLQISTIQWLPFTFLFLHRWLDSRRWRDLLGLTLFYVLQSLSCGYWALYLTISLGLALCIVLPAHGRWRQRLTWEQLALFGGLSTVAMLPFFMPYLDVRAAMGFVRDLDEVRFYSASPEHYLSAPANNFLWGRLLYPLGRAEARLWVGLTPLLLALLGLLWPGPADARPQPRWLYLSLALAAFVLSLGPEVTVAGRVLFTGPYRLLYEHFPGFSGLRTAARWGLFCWFFAAVLIGLGVAGLLARLGSGRLRALVIAGLAAALALEMWPTALAGRGPQPVPGTLPPLVAWLKDRPGKGAVLELPLDNPRKNSFYAYLSAYHFRPLVNGYSGYFPRGHQALANLLLEPPSREVIEDLARMGVRWVLVHRQQLSDRRQGPEIIGALEANRDLVRKLTSWRWGMTEAFELTPPDAPAWKPPRSAPLPTASLQASPLPQDAPRALDGDPRSRWGIGQPQSKGGYFAVQFKHPVRLSGLEMDLGHHPEFYPRRLRLELQDAQGRWRRVPYRTRLYPLAQIMARPAQVRAYYYLLLLQPQEASGLRLTLEPPARENLPWAMHELRLLPAPPAAPAPSSQPAAAPSDPPSPPLKGEP
ncbi:MAG: hypothetical protein AB1814_10395 [Thermodesulfobacteriota bacterium]